MEMWMEGDFFSRKIQKSKEAKKPRSKEATCLNFDTMQPTTYSISMGSLAY
jgi:hypothetical protein